MYLCRAIVAAAIPLYFAGCSTFEARKLAPDEQIRAGEGIPYVLTRAEPRVTRTLKDGKPAYDLTIVYLPDPDQRYTLRANPSWIADVDFSLSFDDDGALKTVDAVTTERITPTITAVGTLISSVIPLAFFRELDDRKMPDIKFARALQEQMTIFDCPAVEDANLNGIKSVKEQLNELVERIKAEVLAWASVDGSIDPDATFKDLFHVETTLQKRCLDDLAKHLEQPAATASRGDELEMTEGQKRAHNKEIIAFIKTVRVFGLAQRHAHLVARFQRELEQEIRLTALNPHGNYNVEQKRTALAKAVGKDAELAQLKKLEEKLAAGAPEPSGDSSSYEEYARMRDQAKALRTEITDAIGEALTALAPPALRPFSGRPVRIVDAGCFKTPATGRRCPNDKDEFVVVFERAPGGQPGDER